MNPQEEERLTAEIDQALRGLPELQAPATLVQRVSAAVERRQCAPWYRRPWQAWPVPMRAASLVMLAAFFTAVCFGVWRIPDTQGYVGAARRVVGWFAGLTTLWGALGALLAALARVVQELGRGFLLGCAATITLAWALCFGLGAACLRLVLDRR